MCTLAHDNFENAMNRDFGFRADHYLVAGLTAQESSQGFVRERRRSEATIRASGLCWLIGLIVFSGVTMAQLGPIDWAEPSAIDGARRMPPRTLTGAGPALPIWHYHIFSPVNNTAYSGYMVGTDPFLRDRITTTTIPVVLVPFVVQFTNTSTGFTTTFDPSTAADAGCTAGQTVMSLVENSPVFQSLPWKLNGIDVGTTQYIDAYQRSNFWRYIQNTGNDYHIFLS